MHILGLCGSLRQHSYNRRLLAAAAKELPDDATFLVFGDLATIPPYNEDIDTGETLVAVQALRGAIAAASGILITTPEYKRVGTGVAEERHRLGIETLSRARPSGQTRYRFRRLRQCLRRHAGAGGTAACAKSRWSAGFEAELAVAQAHDAFAADGRLADAELRLELASLVQALVASVTESSK